MKKRNMSLILVLALILCLIPATAFADTAETLSGDISSETVITKDTTTSGEVNVKSGGSIVVNDGKTLTLNHTTYVSTGGSIVVKDGAKLIVNKTLDLASKADGQARVLKIEEGGKLVVKGNLFSKNNFADVAQLGTMEVSGTNAYVIMYAFVEGYQTTYIGSNGLITLDSNAVITSTPLTAGTYGDGYKYVISGGTATTNNFPNSGKDELVVANGAVLNAANGLTLNSQAGASENQLTVQDGGKLITDSEATGTLASIFGATTAVTQAKITSGIYTEDPTSYVAKGYTVKETSSAKETTYTVNPAGILSKIAVTVKDPVIGETPATTFKSTVEAKGSATASVNVIWFKMSKAEYEDPDNEHDWILVEDNEKFQKDYYYACPTYFVLSEGYEVSENLVATVNGKKADKVFDAGVVEDDGAKVIGIAKVFGPLTEKAKSPATGDNNELGLFAVAGLISALGVALMLRRKHSM